MQPAAFIFCFVAVAWVTALLVLTTQSIENTDTHAVGDSDMQFISNFHFTLMSRINCCVYVIKPQSIHGLCYACSNISYIRRFNPFLTSFNSYVAITTMVSLSNGFSVHIPYTYVHIAM